jgi:hypothetical protein
MGGIMWRKIYFSHPFLPEATQYAHILYKTEKLLTYTQLTHTLFVIDQKKIQFCEFKRKYVFISYIYIYLWIFSPSTWN